MSPISVEMITRCRSFFCTYSTSHLGPPNGLLQKQVKVTSFCLCSQESIYVRKETDKEVMEEAFAMVVLAFQRQESSLLAPMRLVPKFFVVRSRWDAKVSSPLCDWQRVFNVLHHKEEAFRRERLHLQSPLLPKGVKIFLCAFVEQVRPKAHMIASTCGGECQVKRTRGWSWLSLYGQLFTMDLWVFFFQFHYYMCRRSSQPVDR